MKKLFVVMMLCAAALNLPVNAADAAKTPAEIARISFEALQKGDLKTLLPYATGSAKTNLEAIANLPAAVEQKNLEDVIKYILMASGKAHDAKTVKSMAAVIKMQNKEAAIFDEAQKKIDKYKNTKIGSIKENIKGDIATTSTSYILNNGSTKTEMTHFKKIDGKWFVVSPADLRKNLSKSSGTAKTKKH